MCALWAELPDAIVVAMPRIRSSVEQALADFTTYDQHRCASLCSKLFAALSIREVLLIPEERYWLWHRVPLLVAKEGFFMTAIGLWIGEQCY